MRWWRLDFICSQHKCRGIKTSVAPSTACRRFYAIPLADVARLLADVAIVLADVAHLLADVAFPSSLGERHGAFLLLLGGGIVLADVAYLLADFGFPTSLARAHADVAFPTRHG